MIYVHKFWALMIISGFISLITAAVVTVKVNVVVGVIAYFIVNFICTAYIVTKAVIALDRENSHGQRT